jgi:hypothetical protein
MSQITKTGYRWHGFGRAAKSEKLLKENILSKLPPFAEKLGIKHQMRSGEEIRAGPSLTAADRILIAASVSRTNLTRMRRFYLTRNFK